MGTTRVTRVGGFALGALSLMTVAGCIAPDAEVVGKVGVTVDDQQRPIIVMEACDATAEELHLSKDREGLPPEEPNEQLGEWTAEGGAPGRSELALHAPASPWAGDPVTLPDSGGVIAGATGTGWDEVLSQVSFRVADLETMEPGVIQVNQSTGSFALRSMTSEEFRAFACD